MTEARLVVGFSNGLIWQDCLDAQREAQSLMRTLVAHMSAAEGVTEQLKASNQLMWVAKTESIRSRATEMVIADVIQNPLTILNNGEDDYDESEV